MNAPASELLDISVPTGGGTCIPLDDEGLEEDAESSPADTGRPFAVPGRLETGVTGVLARVSPEKVFSGDEAIGLCPWA